MHPLFELGRQVKKLQKRLEAQSSGGGRGSAKDQANSFNKMIQEQAQAHNNDKQKMVG